MNVLIMKAVSYTHLDVYKRQVRKCRRLPFHQTKNGVPALTARWMKSWAAAMVSSSTVSMRFLVSGPVFSIFWPPLPSAQVWSLSLIHI